MIDSKHHRADADIPMTPWMMEADRQWTRDRPRFVADMKRKGVYRETLQMAAERAHRMKDELLRAGADPFTATSDAKAQHLYLDDEETMPTLPPDLAPFGQPEPRGGRRKERKR